MQCSNPFFLDNIACILQQGTRPGVRKVTLEEVTAINTAYAVGVGHTGSNTANGRDMRSVGRRYLAAGNPTRSASTSSRHSAGHRYTSTVTEIYGQLEDATLRQGTRPGVPAPAAGTARAQDTPPPSRSAPATVGRTGSTNGAASPARS